ncbi:MAG: preprotein translocase subunit SecG [Bacteroidia bacterium]|jgi:preprotein translocase subunit SecG
MFLFISIVILIACVLLVLIVLIQNPKGGGIAANFIAPNQIMGVKRSTDVVEKATWVLAATLIVLSLMSNFFRPTLETSDSGVPESRMKENIENTEMPAAPVQAAPNQTQPQPQPEQTTPEQTTPAQ